MQCSNSCRTQLSIVIIVSLIAYKMVFQEIATTN